MPDASGAGGPRPFFILGSHGSGSTLLRLMLDSHENIAVPQETGVMRLVTAHRWIPFWELGAGWHERLGVDAAQLDRRLGELYGGMFADYAAARGKGRWGEKTPFHVWHVEEIRRLFPDAMFVVIVRHPFGAVASILRRFDKRLAKALTHWLGSTREVVQRAATPDIPLCVLRYEDLVRDPETALRELLEWLGEPWSDRVLQHHEVQRRQAPRVVEGGTRTTEAIDPARVDRWRRWFDDEDRSAVAEQTDGWARFFGYDPDPAGPLLPLAPAGSGRTIVATAAELTARRTDFPDLDFSPPPRPRNEELLLPRGRRKRRRALRRSSSPARQVAREMFEQLPPAVQRRARAARRRRPRRQGR